MNRIMILGAGISQVPLIKKAKEMGLYVIVVSRAGSYPGFAYADQVIYEDTTDVEKVLSAARSQQIDGICTTGTDVAVRSIGKAVSILQLPGVGYESAVASSNKYWMKEAFTEHGVRTAKFIKVVDLQDAIRAYEELRPPVIFKATDSGASKGIIKVSEREHIPYAYETVMKATKQPFFLVEEYIDGIEFGAQAFVYNKEVEFILPHGDLLFYGDAGVPIGHYVPCGLPEAVENDIVEQMRNSVKALKLDNCAVNADFILRDNEVYVLEIGARAGATCLPELVSTYYGFDYYEQMLKVALDMEPDFSVKETQPCACELLISDTEGEIQSQRNENEQSEDIIEISFDYNTGDSIRKFNVGTDRIGQIIIKGESVEQILNRLKDIKSKIHIETRNDHF